MLRLYALSSLGPMTVAIGNEPMRGQKEAGYYRDLPGRTLSLPPHLAAGTA
jgi:hypothetical protein